MGLSYWPHHAQRGGAQPAESALSKTQLFKPLNRAKGDTKMKTRTWMFGPAALVLALGMAGSASAKDNDVKTPVRLAAAEKPAKIAKIRNLTAKQIAEIEK